MPSLRHKHLLRLVFEVVVCDMSVINWSQYKENDRLERLDSSQVSPVGVAKVRSRKEVRCPEFGGKMPKIGLC